MSPLIFLAICLKITLSTCTDPKIIGGEPVQEGEIPYQVSLRYSLTNQHFCGGSIISPKYVLTAAHCVDNLLGFEKYLFVVAGQVSLNITGWNKTRKISKIIVHPEYNKNKFLNDIALLQLAKNFILDNILIDRIQLNHWKLIDNTKCFVSGWGTYDMISNEASQNLLIADVYIVDVNDCRIKYTSEIVISEGMICAANTLQPADSCQGDSGGPLVCDDFLTGVVSFGIGCADKDYPGVYTDVEHFLPWIEQYTKKFPYCDKTKLSWYNPLWLFCQIFNLWI